MSANDHWEQVKALFVAASELPEGERPAYLERVCVDPRMRAEVQDLLAADSDATAWLTATPSVGRDEATGAAKDLEGTRVGRFDVLHRIGSGGMGAVYLAERTDDGLTQQAALKVIQRGMVSDHAIARFLREREILARLDHPGICALIDSGVTADGRPYFVMPFLEGALPVTDYCDQKALGIRRRLTLFEQICAAVHHAHRNLVVHGDLKPANVLVTGEGHVQLVDFGVSRLLASDSTTLTSQYGAERPISLTNASPEQIEGWPPTTSSDVYSLGVLLYQLLAGASPWTIRPGDELKAQIDNRPLPARTTERGRMPEDLYNIGLKAMEIDPDRRYASVMALAEDVERWLEDRPVTARAPGTLYRLGKFIKRNLWPVATATVGVAAVVVIGVVLAVSAARTAQERDRAEATAEFWAHLFEQTDPVHSREAVPDVIELLGRAESELTGDSELAPGVRARLLGEVSTAYWNLGRAEDARRSADAAVALLDESDVDAKARALAYVHQSNIAISQIDTEVARRAVDRALYWAGQSNELTNSEQAMVLEANALVLEVEEKRIEAVEAMEQAIDLREQSGENDRIDLANAYGNLAYMYFKAGRQADESETWFEQADENIRASLALLRDELGPEHPRVASMLNASGRLNMERGRLEAALENYSSAVEIAAVSLPPGHEMYSYLHYNRGVLNRQLGRIEESVAAFAAAAEAALSGLSDDHPRYREALVGQIRGLLALGDTELAGDRLAALADVLPDLADDDPTRLWHEVFDRQLQAARSESVIDEPWLSDMRRRSEALANTELSDYVAQLGRQAP